MLADQGHLDRPSIEVAYHSAKDLLELIGDIEEYERLNRMAENLMFLARAEHGQRQ